MGFRKVLSPDRDNPARILIKLIDLFSLLLAAEAAFFIKFGHLVIPQRYQLLVALAICFSILVFPTLELRFETQRRPGRLLAGWLLNAYALVAIFVISILFLTKTSSDFSRIWVASWIMSALFLSVFFRFLIRPIIHQHRRSGKGARSVTVIGSPDICAEIQQKILNDPLSGFVIEHVHSSDQSEQLDRILSAFTGTDGLLNVTTDEVWICLPIARGNETTVLINRLRYFIGDIRYIPDLTGFKLLNHGVVDIAGFSAINLSCSPIVGFSAFIKRLEDVFLSLIGIIICSPVYAIVAAGIVLTSKGKIFYTQERIGWNGKVFRMIKFRSMPESADQQELVWGRSEKKVDTRFGRFIRKTSLDELPQLFNVLMGDMSIVGPRPERPVFVEQFKEQIPGYMQKHIVKAGLTGWAQVNGWRGDTSLVHRIEHDLYYIDNWSLWFDIKIIVMTVLGAFFDRGAKGDSI
ncbi:undecaprenyl-phosphate glucose phosphotransferase [Marinobacter sp. C2H3]|uniref:undecaprenyl-phosphate glucose phosphotransferase n=1 Tax=Marinobacter sp. C2H3 TaxID=3119003 RepID=UPI00300E9312